MPLEHLEKKCVYLHDVTTIKWLIFCFSFSREEVLREQFGIGLQAAARGSTGPSSSNQETVEEPQEVSPEFLAALPPEVQQEVKVCF